MNNYHVRVHYRTANKNGRRVSWFRYIKAENETDAGNKAIQRVVSRKTNSGVVEVESVESIEVRPMPTGERAKIVAWFRKMNTSIGRYFADAIERGEHLK